jgi:hypothetical protein
MTPDLKPGTIAPESFDTRIGLTEARDREADSLVEPDGISVCLGLDPTRIGQCSLNHRPSDPRPVVRPLDGERSNH